MRTFALYFVLIVSPSVLLSGCGGSSSVGSGSGDVPAVVTMHDTPAGANILSFDITISSISLVGENGTANANLLSSPVTVQMRDLLTQSVEITNANITGGSYSGVTVTFSNPNYTLQNTGSTTLSLTASQTCVAGAICTVTPTLNQVSATFSSSPFPLTLSASTPLDLSIDLNVAGSVQSDFTITPTIAVSTPATVGNGAIADLSATGQITSVGSGTFTVTNGITGQSVVFTTNTSTTYSNFAQGVSAGCTAANTSACLAQDQNVTLNYSVSSSSVSTNTATGVTLASGITNGVTGIVVATNPGANQFTMVIIGASPSVTGATMGQTATVTVPTTSTAFAVQSGALTLPGTLTFTGAGNIVVGQTIAVNSSTSSVTDSAISANEVLLMPTQFAGTVSGVSGATLVVNGLNGMFGSSTTISVSTQSATTYSGLTSLAELTAENYVAVSALVYDNGSGYQAVAQTVGNGQ